MGIITEPDLTDEESRGREIGLGKVGKVLNGIQIRIA